jgi:hypothetical protein
MDSLPQMQYFAHACTVDTPSADPKTGKSPDFGELSMQNLPCKTLQVRAGDQQ